MTFSDAEETMNDNELPDYKEDGMDMEMQLADRYFTLYSISYNNKVCLLESNHLYIFFYY